MKKWSVLIVFLLPLIVKAQNITTFAGTGASVFSGNDVPAITAGIPDPIGGTFDKYGNYYFADGINSHRIRKIDTAGVISTVVGTGAGGYNGDTIVATAAQLEFPNTVRIDTSGNMYIVDGQAHRIRKVDVTTGLIYTIAGIGTGGFGGDSGLATAANIYNPQDLCLDKQGNIYIADYWNNRVRKINAATGIITTIAGGGISGVGDNGPATAAQLVSPWCITVDDTGNIYIGEESSSTLSNRIRKVDTFGIITTIAGNGAYAFSGYDIPATTASISPIRIGFDTSWQLYIADDYNKRVYRIDHAGILRLVAGNGTAGFGGDDSVATDAKLNYPAGIAFDPCGNLYIPEPSNRRIRKVTFDTSCHAHGSVSVKQTETTSAISIYPNPATTELNITASHKITVVIITNTIGQVLQKEKPTTEKAELNIAHLPVGVYMLRITDDVGNTAVKKFIKE